MSTQQFGTIGRYQILEEVGRGGMAIVYKAVDTDLNRIVAIKLIRKTAFPPDELEPILNRFKREAKALAKIDHPNIVKLLDYGEFDGAPFLAMEFLEGRTLKELKKPIPVKTAVQLLHPIANALQYIHGKNLLHRDVKPSNIIITKQRKVVLTDFGIAKWIAESQDTLTLTGTGVGIGTPEYMAPEQGSGRFIDGRTDQYSLSVVFYELITGYKPYHGDTPLQLMVKHITEPIPDPRKLNPNISNSIVIFLNQALAKNPNERFPSMKDYIMALESLSNDNRDQPVCIQQNYHSNNANMGKSNSINSSNSQANRNRLSSVFKNTQLLILCLFAAVLVLAALLIKETRNNDRLTNQTSINIGAPIKSESNLSEESTSETIIHRLTETAEERILTTKVAQALIAIREREPGGSPNPAAVDNPQPTDRPTMEIITDTPIPTNTQIPTNTAIPTKTPVPTNTQIPTNTAIPTQTPAPTNTPVPTNTAVPTATAIPATATPSFYFGTLRVGDTITFGTYPQFYGNEPIEWIVLETNDSDALLISRYGLDAIPYSTSLSPTTWETSYLRRWLNTTFYSSAFSEREKNQIVSSIIQTEDNPNYSIDGGLDTVDYIFVLSRSEAERLFSGNDARACIATNHAIANGAKINQNNNHYWWFLRTPGYRGENAAYVGTSGAIYPDGTEVTDAHNAIRPALRVYRMTQS